ncbi:MAG: glutamine-hydrolyzing carbamoyl-phosphate synthase small subunit [SAR324 cluster bacterium]|nr:glutamine-hydrolyzing carbamoyl-phosphate synthase small subunit [SAR324 cluster bacterium]
MKKTRLVLQNGLIFEGEAFGYEKPASGELIFNTGMVGYAETLSDPSYKGQILVFTYPLIGNYGIFSDQQQKGDIPINFESEKIHVAGVVVNSFSEDYYHYQAKMSFDSWLKKLKIPAITGVDTRAITLNISNSGSRLAKIESEEENYPFFDPNKENLVKEVSIKAPKFYDAHGDKTVLIVDTGMKSNILRYVLSKKINVQRVPWNYDFKHLKFDGILLGNGPGNPELIKETIAILQTQLTQEKPILGICLGHQLLAIAGGASTYKMKFGHHSQNQPCVLVGTKRVFITSQNHGFAVDESSFTDDWQPWFFNANDGSNEGMRHKSKPFFSVQFHPEASPGPTDTNFILDEFLALL